MGVQHLWSILEQSKRGESIEHLRDKTLCIDLSLWICEAQVTKGLKDQLKPYLRNVFFRTMYLTSVGVRPVFVIDGIPPEVKRETILKRLQARHGQSSKRGEKQSKIKRSKFSIWCNECCEMFKLLGIPFVRSEGEAEAMCAWLNVNKHADGVLTDDGDVFLYGAKVVYKDFNVSSTKFLTDCLQVYNLVDIESQLGLNQRNMIALALLLGCDYLPAGVPGIGKETVVRLLSTLSGVDLLDRFHEWKLSPDVHPQDYTSLELAVKKKAVKVPNFPNEAVIKEFLSPKLGSKNINIKWTCPDLEGIKEFFFRKLVWPKDYTEEKMLSLVTDWQLTYTKPSVAPSFVPVRIIKQRTKQKMQYYEVEWKTQDVKSKYPVTFVSTKAGEIIRQKHSTLVENFESEMMAKKSKSKAKKNLKTKTASCADGAEQLEDLVSKINIADLEDNPKPAEHDQDYLATNHALEDSEDTKLRNELAECASKGDTRQEFHLLDNIFGSEAHLKVDLTSASSLHNYSEATRLCKHDEVKAHAFRGIMVDVEEKGSLDGVFRSTKNSVSMNKAVHDKTGNSQSPPSEEGRKMSSIVCSDTFGVGSPCNSLYQTSPEFGLNKLSKCHDLLAANERTPLNLVNITLDQSFGSDLGTIEDLLTSSFVARLKDISCDGQSSPRSNQAEFYSPFPEVYERETLRCSRDKTQGWRDAVFPNHEEDNFVDSFRQLGLTTDNNCNEDTVNEASDCNDQRDGHLPAKEPTHVPGSSTPQLIEESCLASRLLKRFQKDDAGFANTLRLISSSEEESEHKFWGKEKNKISSFDRELSTTQQKSHAASNVVSGNIRLLNDITNQKTDEKNIVLIVLD